MCNVSVSCEWDGHSRSVDACGPIDHASVGLAQAHPNMCSDQWDASEHSTMATHAPSLRSTMATHAPSLHSTMATHAPSLRSTMATHAPSLRSKQTVASQLSCFEDRPLWCGTNVEALYKVLSNGF